MTVSKKALVTGATGFVGSHLARRLVKDGWKVTAISRSSSDRKLVCDIESSVRFYEYDGKIESMQMILEDARPEIIFHLASTFLSEHQSQDIDSLIQSNITFGTHLVEAAIAIGCSQFINAGTAWQHFNNERYSPVNLYAATKQAFEDILKYYVEVCGLKVIILKLFDTYGPDDPRPKLVNLLKRAAGTGETLCMSPGEQLIDLVHVDDVVNAFCVAEKIISEIDIGVVKEYGVMSDSPITLKEVVLKFEKEIGKNLKVDWGCRPYRVREMMIPCNSLSVLPNWSVNKKKYFG